MSYLKFTGNFRDLIPLGFKFQKLYARNYRCYHTAHRKEGHKGYSLWVWQKDRRVEIEDWHEFEVLIIEYMKGKEFPMRSFELRGGEYKTDTISFKCNREDGTIELGTPENDDRQFSRRHFKGELTQEESLNLYAKYFNKYRNIVVSPSEFRVSIKVLEGLYTIQSE